MTDLNVDKYNPTYSNGGEIGKHTAEGDLNRQLEDLLAKLKDSSPKVNPDGETDKYSLLKDYIKQANSSENGAQDLYQLLSAGDTSRDLKATIDKAYTEATGLAPPKINDFGATPAPAAVSTEPAPAAVSGANKTVLPSNPYGLK